MKLSKKALTLLGVGILVIAFASLGFAYLKQSNELARLDDELFLAEQSLNNINIKSLSYEEETLEKRLNQLTAQLDSNPDKVDLSQLVLSTDTTDELFDIAELCNVQIYSITSAGMGEGELEDLELSALPATVTAYGDVTNLITYVTRLNDDFTNGTVMQVVIKVPEEKSEDEDTEEEKEVDWFNDEIAGYDIPLPNLGDNATDEDKPDEPEADIQMMIYMHEDGK